MVLPTVSNTTSEEVETRTVTFTKSGLNYLRKVADGFVSIEIQKLLRQPPRVGAVEAFVHDGTIYTKEELPTGHGVVYDDRDRVMVIYKLHEEIQNPEPAQA